MYSYSTGPNNCFEIVKGTKAMVLSPLCSSTARFITDVALASQSPYGLLGFSYAPCRSSALARKADLPRKPFEEA
jgi:hypothetical protein